MIEYDYKIYKDKIPSTCQVVSDSLRSYHKLIKDLKVKGSSSAIKQGTKVKGIRLVHDSANGHDIDCKIDGFGAMSLKSEFVKKI